MVKHHENPPKSLECKQKPKESPEKKLKTLKNEFQMEEPVVKWSGLLEHATIF